LELISLGASIITLWISCSPTIQQKLHQHLSSWSGTLLGQEAAVLRQLYFPDMQKLQPDNFQTNWHPKEIPQILVVKNPYPASQAHLSTRWWRILLSPAPEISTRRDVLPCILGSTAEGTVKALLSVKGRWEWRESLGYLHEEIQRDPFGSQLVNWSLQLTLNNAGKERKWCVLCDGQVERRKTCGEEGRSLWRISTPQRCNMHYIEKAQNRPLQSPAHLPHSHTTVHVIHHKPNFDRKLCLQCVLHLKLNRHSNP
jgi:hypothetical protein